MTKQQTEQRDDKESNAVEDLILRDAESSDVKGGTASQSLLKLEGVPGESRDHLYK